MTAIEAVALAVSAVLAAYLLLALVRGEDG
jgi:hypothetical protein